MKKFNLFITILILVFVFVIRCFSEVNIPDPNLEAAIRKVLKKPEGPIRKEDLENLTKFGATRSNIVDLTGLEYCVNLTSLNLAANEISDLTPLSSLTKLTELYLIWNQISDISPLSSLRNLNILLLSDNKIENIDALKNLIHLGHPIDDPDLDLRDNNIENIKPLVENEGLDIDDRIDLRGNPLSSKSIDKYIKKLQNRGVSVKYTPKGGIELDADLEKVIRSYLNKKIETPIEKEDLESLTKLNINPILSGHIRSLSGLEYCVNLTQLAINKQIAINDLHPLKNLTKLTELSLEDNEWRLSNVWSIVN